MVKANLTLGAFSVPFADAFVEEDGIIAPKFKSIKRFAAIFTDNCHVNLKLILPEEGQLGVLTDSGYQDGVLGLMQEGKADICFLPLPLIIPMAPGHFSPVISEQNYYILTFRNLNDHTSAIISSLTSFAVIPVFMAALTILLLELIAVKHLKIEVLLSSIFKSIGISFYQNSSNHSVFLCFIQMIILMFPVFIFNSAFSTQAIVGTADYKVNTLNDVVNQGKIPYYIEGISMHDFFKGEVTKEYADIYERSVSEGLEEPFQLGPIPSFERSDKMVTFLSDTGRKLAPLTAAGSNLITSDQELYFSAKPFHKSLQAILLSDNLTESVGIVLTTMLQRMSQSGIPEKIETDIFIEFILSVYQVTLYDFHKSQDLGKGNYDLKWQPLNYIEFKHIFYSLILILVLSILVLLIELIIVFLFKHNFMRKLKENFVFLITEFVY